MEEDFIIRRGNHFVKMVDGIWILIEGPWFDILQIQSINYGKILNFSLSLFGYTNTYCSIDSSVPAYIPSIDMFWMQTLWNPGHYTTRPHPNARDYFKWSNWQYRRSKVGWRVKSGNVPCYLHFERPAFDWEQDEYLLSLEEIRYKQLSLEETKHKQLSRVRRFLELKR